MDPELDPLAAGGLLERIVAWAGQAVGTPNGYICLIEPDSGEMVLRLGTGAYTGLVGLRMLKGEGLSGRVWETGEPLAIPDYSRWEGRVRQIAADDFRAVLGVPLISGGNVTGVIGLAFSEPGREFSKDEVHQVSRFAEVASIALDNARLYAAAQQELVERKKAEGRFRTLVEEIPAIVYSEEFEVGGARQYVNRQVEELFGFTAEEASRANFWKTTVHPDDLERVLAEEARCEQTGEPFRMEYRCFTRSGEVRWIRDQCVLVRDEAGRPLFWQGVSVDITDTKRALELEREATRRLRALDQMKNTFLDAVSHELRTPLAAIVGIGLTLEHKADILADADRSDLYTRLVANARKLDRLLNDLLDLDRLTHGIVAPKRRPTDVAALAARIADDWGLLNGRRPAGRGPAADRLPRSRQGRADHREPAGQRGQAHPAGHAGVGAGGAAARRRRGPAGGRGRRRRRPGRAARQRVRAVPPGPGHPDPRARGRDRADPGRPVRRAPRRAGLGGGAGRAAAPRSGS